MDRDLKPNILMIVEDHVAFYGHKQIKRPYLEQLKQEGVSFENTYCSTPLCMPSRKTMMTGLYPHAHGQRDNSFETGYEQTETYLGILKEQGYETYYFGKWHAGKGIPADLGCKGISYPDYSNPYHQKEYQDYIKEKELPPAAMKVEVNMCEKGWIDDVEEGDIYRFTRPLLNEALSGVLEAPKESHEAFYVSEMACRQLEEIQKTHKEDMPFMMRVDFWGPHQPYHPAKEYTEMYPLENMGEYPSFHDTLEGKPESYFFDTGRDTSENKRLKIPNALPEEKWRLLFSRCYAQNTMVDEAAGRIIEKLKDLHLDENTVIIWLADHGDALGCHGGHFDKAFYMPEEVLRIPFVMSYPGVLPKGEVSSALISNADLAPTLAAIAHGKMEQIEGRSILELYHGQKIPWRDSVISETFGHLAPWEAKAVRSGKYKYVWNKDDVEELYDLEEDPYEMQNLAEEKIYKEILSKMRGKMEKR